MRRARRDRSTEVGTGLARPQPVPLSQLIDIVNTRFGTDFNQADQLFFDQVVEAAMANDGVRQAAVNPGDKFELVFEGLLQNLFAERMDQNEDIFVRFMNDEAFQNVVTRWMSSEAYRRLRSEDDAGSGREAAGALPPTLRLVHPPPAEQRYWLGQSAISDAEARATPDQAVERWCNRVAAELLVPLAALRDVLDRHPNPHLDLNRLARRFKVSTLVILRRIHDAGRLTREELWTAYDAELARLRALPKGSGGDFYLTLGARVSKRFARALVVSTLEGRTAFTETFRMLGLKKMETFNELGRGLGVGY